MIIIYISIIWFICVFITPVVMGIADRKIGESASEHQIVVISLAGPVGLLIALYVLCCVSTKNPLVYLYDKTKNK